MCSGIFCSIEPDGFVLAAGLFATPASAAFNLHCGNQCLIAAMEAVVDVVMVAVVPLTATGSLEIGDIYGMVC